MSELTVTLIGVSDASLSLAQLLDASSPTIENRKDQNYQVSAAPPRRLPQKDQEPWGVIKPRQYQTNDIAIRGKANEKMTNSEVQVTLHDKAM